VSLGFLPNIAVDANGNIYASDWYNKVVHVFRPGAGPVLISSVVDAASRQAGAISPGKIVVIYGSALGPMPLVQNQPNFGVLGTNAGGTQVMFNGIAAPILYASVTQAAAIVPYEVTGGTATVSVSYQGQDSNTVTLAVTPSAPNIFTLNQTGAGQAAALNVPDFTVNTAATPAKGRHRPREWMASQEDRLPRILCRR
jgi:IPT/TIG domain